MINELCECFAMSIEHRLQHIEVWRDKSPCAYENLFTLLVDGKHFLNEKERLKKKGSHQKLQNLSNLIHTRLETSNKLNGVPL